MVHLESLTPPPDLVVAAGALAHSPVLRSLHHYCTATTTSMVGVHVDMMWWNLRTHKPVLVLHPVRPVLLHTVHIVVLHPVRPVLLHTVPTVPIVVLHPVPIVVLHSVPTMLLHPVPTVLWHPMPTMLLHAVTTVLLHPVPAMVSIFMPSLPSITHLSLQNHH